MAQPNILLIVADQFRGDCLGILGHPDVKTPFLDTLAAKGVAFNHAYTACPSCIPARASLYTGLSQRSHGRVGYRDGVRWNYPHTLAGELTAAGYLTQCVGKMHVHPLRNLCGFMNVELHDGFLHHGRDPGVPYAQNQFVADDYFHWLRSELGDDADVTDTGMEANSWTARPWIYPEKYHPTNWVTSRSIDFLRRRDTDKPFFLMASYVRPHPPLDAPSYYFDLYRDKALTPPVTGDWEEDESLGPKGRIADSDTGPADPELRRQMQIGYYACITHLDHQIGRLVQSLVERKLYDNTLIIFTADHGELLGDHHLFRKVRPYQGSVRVPLIVSGAPGFIGRPGQVCPSLAELRDVLPTALHAAGAPAPAGTEGVSLLPWVRGEQGPAREYLHGEHSGGMASNHFIVTQGDKYIWYSQTGREQYFNLEEDPGETRDRIADPACRERVDALRRRLIGELTGREEGYTDGERLITGRAPRACLGCLTGEE